MTGTDQHDEGGVEAQAAQWFARLRTLPVSRETLEDFFAWQRDEAHSAAFDAIERLWSRAGDMGDRPAILAATRAAMRRKAERHWLLPVWPAHPALAALTILLLVLLGVGATYWVMRPGADEYMTKVGQRSVVALADGSRVSLDTDTRIATRFNTDERRVVLAHGQAYFIVAHETARPFRVEADGTEVVATGTQFAVRRDAAAVDVTLVEGSVRVVPQGSAPRTLRPRQRMVLRPDRTVVVQGVDIKTATAWRQGRIVLDGWTLARALSEVNRYTTQPVRLEATRFANARLSGTFDAGDIKSFVAAATALLPLTAVRDTDGSVRLVDRAAQEKTTRST
ncbi:FecR domain-containing protein [Sphingomonas sp. NFR15]|uniref:FecR family protein n=1 Tax=Sphingomonas sp. NFR15 TaxID=1566282 RepID=UPI00088B7636|nr:FecR domain-containing protein [Sphingomonas sp. NFR15]SDA36914.1 FecR family protein [Sphingomonas sp. NFR15]